MGELAYLVLYLDTSVFPAEVKGAGIYSEDASSLEAPEPNTFPLTVLSVGGADYEAAHAELVKQLKIDLGSKFSRFMWIEPFIRDELED